jgi:hypothetical protein
MWKINYFSRPFVAESFTAINQEEALAISRHILASLSNLKVPITRFEIFQEETKKPDPELPTLDTSRSSLFPFDFIS